MVGRCGALAERAEALRTAAQIDAWLAEVELVEATAEALLLVAPSHGSLLLACSADLRAFRRDVLGR